jgi:type II secretory pathway pseudopilin PulG
LILKKKDLNSQGFTLIELLLYVVVVSFVISGIGFFFLLVMQSKTKSQTVLEVEQQGAQIVRRINQVVRNSEGINSPSKQGSGTTLSVDAVDSGIDPTIFSLSGGILQIQEGGGAAVDLSNSRVTISNLNFQNLSQSDSPDSVSFQFDISFNNPEGRNEYNYSTTFYGAASARR